MARRFVAVSLTSRIYPYCPPKFSGMRENGTRAFELLLRLGKADMLCGSAGAQPTAPFDDDMMKNFRFPRIENKPQAIALAALFIGNLCFINFLSRYAGTIIPGTGDEHSIVFQSKVFAKLWLSAPPPPLPEFFQTDLVVVQNNRWYGVNPPVYPLMLSPGSMIHNEALIVSLLSSSILMLLFFLVKNIYRDAPLAWLTVLIFWLSPSFLGSSPKRVGDFGLISDRVEHAGENF